ncbi:hypothetical protein BKA81DRAFT_381175 [Phyllosticta paracitricarpa]|uniref:Uncharacterized protein n=1 Tax=Phyllosticta paracitricarpa TaxID=2016321 RepID=A0ABR1N1N7_9PEZI
MPSLSEKITNLLTVPPLPPSARARSDPPPSRENASPGGDDVGSIQAKNGSSGITLDVELKNAIPQDLTHDPASELKESKKLNEQQARQIRKLSSALEQTEDYLKKYEQALRNERLESEQTRLGFLHKLQKTQADLDTAMADLRKAQLSTFKQARSDWVPEEDSKVRDDVSQLYKDIRTWAKTYADSGAACANRLSSLDEMLRSQFVTRISNVARLSGTDEIKEMKHPFLILAALLSQHLQLLIFDNPFFWLNDDEHNPSLAAFSQLFRAMCKTRFGEAQAWRAQLTRFLFMSGDNKDTEQPVGNAVMSKKDLDNLCKDFICFFISDEEKTMLRVLDKTERQVRDNELFSLTRRAVILYGRLQTQRTCYNWIKPTQILGTDFSASSPYLRADRLHKIDEDEEDTTLDGSKVKIVLSPVVLACGNSRGEDYNSHRVIAKATVYLE